MNAHVALFARRGITITSLCLGMVLFASPAFSLDSKSPAPSAKTLYEQGVRLTDQGKLVEAEAKFEEAWALQKSYDIAANLGEVSMRLKKPAAAAQYFTFAIKNFPASGKQETLARLESSLAKAKNETAAITVVVNVAGAEVRINGKPAGKAPIEGEVFVSEGDCTITVTAPGLAPFTQTIRAKAGSSHKVAADLMPPAQSPLPGFVVGGVGLATFATGLALYFVSNDKYDEAHKLHDGIVASKTGSTHCVEGKNPNPQCGALKSAAEQADALYAPGLGLLVGGAVLTVAGGAYLGYTLRTTASTPPTNGAAPKPKVTRVGVQGAGLFVRGEF